MNLTALVMMIMTQGVIITATSYFLYKVMSSPSKIKEEKAPFSQKEGYVS